MGNARMKYLPRILQYHKDLEAAGQITDEFVEDDLKKFVTALDLYGSIQRLEEAPDKYSRKLQKVAKSVGKFGKEKQYGEMMEALESYRSSVPAGAGYFQWSDIS